MLLFKITIVDFYFRFKYMFDICKLMFFFVFEFFIVLNLIYKFYFILKSFILLVTVKKTVNEEETKIKM